MLFIARSAATRKLLVFLCFW